MTIGIALLSLVLITVFWPKIYYGYLGFQQQRRLSHGQELAQLYCTSCHLVPSPDILPKKSWEVALAYMGYMLGIDNIDYLDDHPEIGRENVMTKQSSLEKEKMIPDEPILVDSDWLALRNYYVESAAEEPLPQTDRPATRWELPQFDIIHSDYHAEPAVTTLVNVREETGEVYIGDSVAHTVAVVGSDGQLKGEPRVFGPAISPVDIEFIDNSAYLASIGDIFGDSVSTDKMATISRLELVDNGIDDAPISVLIDEMYRMAAMDTADLNGDGKPEFVVCGFGTRQGNVALYMSQADDNYREQVLIGRPGAVKAEFHDFNDDGYLDIAVLLSDALEGFYILMNNGANQFKSNTIFETHPSYGHTYFELQDFNDDGRMDILTVNGDNVDSDPYNTLKNYHGIRLYMNKGGLHFEEEYFFPMYGAFGARAADFDDDGDLDIAAISFYPDFAHEQRESFVYLQNDGAMEFSPHSTPELNNGRWMTLGIGDMDGDADPDIVLGGAYIPVGMFTYIDLYKELADEGQSILILENRSATAE